MMDKRVPGIFYKPTTLASTCLGMFPQPQIISTAGNGLEHHPHVTPPARAGRELTVPEQ